MSTLIGKRAVLKTAVAVKGDRGSSPLASVLFIN